MRISDWSSDVFSSDLSSCRAVHSASLYLLLRLSWVAIGYPLFAIGFVLLPMPQGKGTAQWRSARPGTCDGLPRGGLHFGANLSSGAPSDARVFAALFLLPEYRWPAANRTFPGTAGRPTNRRRQGRLGKECVRTCRSRWSPSH